MSDVALDHISKVFEPGGVRALGGLSITCAGGKTTAILGPSGSGKSTLLRLVAGLDTPTQGRVLIDGRDVAGVPPHRRGVSMVFQNAALYPHMTAAENIAFPLRRRRGLSRREIDERVRAVAEMLRIDEQSSPGLLDRRPAHLSGGERQRVAIAKAIVTEPKILLMDEPLSSLDADLRLALRGEIKALQQRLGITMLYVTHDTDEAAFLADETVRLDAVNA